MIFFKQKTAYEMRISDWSSDVCSSDLDRVSKDEAPKTLEEMADPKWQGRAGTTSHLETMMDGVIDALGEEKAMPLIDRLSELDNRLYPSIADRKRVV